MITFTVREYGCAMAFFSFGISHVSNGKVNGLFIYIIHRFSSIGVNFYSIGEYTAVLHDPKVRRCH